MRIKILSTICGSCSVIFCSLIFGIAEATICKPSTDDPHVCGKLADVKQCFTFQHIDFSHNCTLFNKHRPCMVPKTTCYKIGTTCKKTQCCTDWAEDRNGRCTVYIGPPEAKLKVVSSTIICPPEAKLKVVSSTIILVVIVLTVLVFIIVLAISFKICKHRDRRRNTSSRNSSAMGNVNNAFTVSMNEPPPYDVAVSGSLPEYSHTDKPPEYGDVVGHF